MILIGITGKAGSGKDTVGDRLRDAHRFTTAALAYPIKNTIAHLLGVSETKWEDREWRETPVDGWGVTPRRMAQTFGTEWGRRCLGEDVWLNYLFDEFSGEERLAITDVRFRNEADVVRAPDNGGYIIHVYRMDNEAGTTSEHSSEEGIGNPNTNDFHINNFGTVEDLDRQVDQVVARILVLQQEALEDEEEAIENNA